MSDAPAAKKSRKYPAILFHIPGWPSQEPNRQMVWKVHFDGLANAERTLRRMNKRVKECVWCMEMLTAAEARKIRMKPYTPPDWAKRRPRRVS